MYDIFSSEVISDYSILLSAVKINGVLLTFDFRYFCRQEMKNICTSHTLGEKGQRCQVTTMPKENWASSNFTTQVFNYTSYHSPSSGRKRPKLSTRGRISIGTLFLHGLIGGQRLLISSFVPLERWKPIKAQNNLVPIFSPEKLEEK
jgi:hypothetical protein